LHRLPWTALIDEQQKDGEKYLIQRFAVVIAPSLFALGVYSAHLARNISRRNTLDLDEILVIANPWPLSLPKLPPLLGGEAEAAAIVKLVKAHTGTYAHWMVIVDFLPYIERPSRFGRKNSLTSSRKFSRKAQGLLGINLGWLPSYSLLDLAMSSSSHDLIFPHLLKSPTPFAFVFTALTPLQEPSLPTLRE